MFGEAIAAALGCDGHTYWDKCWRHAAGIIIHTKILQCKFFADLAPRAFREVDFADQHCSCTHVRGMCNYLYTYMQQLDLLIHW